MTIPPHGWKCLASIIKSLFNLTELDMMFDNIKKVPYLQLYGIKIVHKLCLICKIQFCLLVMRCDEIRTYCICEAH